MSRGRQLKVILDNTAVQTDPDEQEQERQRLERRNKIQNEIRDLRDLIYQTIDRSLVPEIKLTDANLRKWIKKARKGRADFQEIWISFVNELEREDLQISITEEYKDYRFRKNWTMIRVLPIED